LAVLIVTFFPPSAAHALHHQRRSSFLIRTTFPRSVLTLFPLPLPPLPLLSLTGGLAGIERGLLLGLQGEIIRGLCLRFSLTSGVFGLEHVSRAASSAAFSAASRVLLATRVALRSATRLSRAILTACLAAWRATSPGSCAASRCLSNAAFFVAAAVLWRSAKLVSFDLFIFIWPSETGLARP
jgi:hypothetical protein